MDAMIELSGGVSLQAVTNDEGRPFAVLKPLCDTLGLSYNAVQQRLPRQRWATIQKICTVGSDGKNRAMTCIDQRTMVMWFAQIEPDDCHPEVRAALYVYQDEAADALLNWATDGGAKKPDVLNDMQVSVIETQRMLAELFRALIPVITEKNNREKEILDVAKRIEDQTKGRRYSIPADSKRRYRATVARFYGGKCPCCQKVTILNDHKALANAQYDHWHHRSMVAVDQCWIVCGDCNSKLRDRKPGGYWFEAAPAFQQFQRLVHDDRQLQITF